jgi:hypothetical protein
MLNSLTRLAIEVNAVIALRMIKLSQSVADRLNDDGKNSGNARSGLPNGRGWFDVARLPLFRLKKFT